MSKLHSVILDDGDTLSVIARLPLSVADPAQIVAAVAQSYRVVAHVYEPVLVLVPLVERPSIVRESELLEREAANK